MNCPGLHCPGCEGGGGIIAIGAVVLAVLGAAAWMAPRLAWVAGVTAACLVLSVVLALVVVPRVARWSDERDAAAYPAQLPARDTPAAFPAAGAPPAIEQHLHLHYHAADGEQVPSIARVNHPRE